DITFALSNEPAGMAVSSTGLITWTPTNGVSTSGNVTLTVSDGGEDGAAADTENFTVTVDAENDPPTITSTAGTTATEDIQYSYQVTVSDPDDTNNGSDISFSLSNAPTGMSVSNTGLVTWTPLEGVLTSGAVTLTVADGGENGSVPDTENFTVTVTSVNDSPVISSSASTSAIEDSLYSYQLVVTDPDDSNNGTDLTFALSNEPTGMTISTTGLVQWTPANGVLTSGEVTVTVTDGGENSSVAATQSWTITVDDVNDPPVISSTAGTAATEDVEYQYQVSVTDPDDNNNGTDISFTLTNAPTGMSVSATGLVSWTPLEGVLTSGSVTLTVADGGESGAVPDTENFTITVTSVNDSPVISSAASTSGIEDDLYSYQVTVTDPDDTNNGTDLTFALSNEPTGMTVSSTGLIQWTPANGVLTSGEITITVSDGGEDSSVPGTQSWTIAVDAVNDPPVITSTAGTAAIEDTEYQYQVEVADPDDTNNGTDITFALTNAPTGMSVSSTGLITWTPLEGVLTSDSVTVSAADGGESGSVPSTEDFTVTVTPVNDEPTISSSPSTSAVEDEVYSYQVTVSDPDDSNNGTDLTFALSNEPAGMTVSSTGLIAWTPTNGVTTSNEVTLTVTDGGEDSATSASQSWTVSVDAVNDAPTITSTAVTTATEDVEYQYQVTVSDPDDTNNGTDITFALTNAPEGMTVSNTGLVRWTPVEGVLTSGQVTLTVADGGESDAVAATELFTVSVTPVDNAPVITSTAVTSATEDVLYQYEVAATDEEGTSLTFSLTTSPAGMTIGATSGVIGWTPTEGVTSEAVVVSVTDGTHTVTQSYSITVTAVNDQPVFTSTPVAVATEDVLYQYPLAASDPEGTALVYSLTSAPDGMTVDASSGLIGWTPTEGVLSGSVTASVTDGELTDSQSFTISVTPVNDGVSVSAVADQSVTELSILSVALTVADVDDSNNGTDIGFELLNAPSGMTVSNLGVISWTPGQSTSGAYSVVVRVFDGLEDNAQAAETSMNVTVIKLDTDTDTVADYLDNCPDAANTDQLDTDADGLGNVCDSDDDGDGISDVAELANGLDPLDSSDAALDLDQDGLNNLAEFELCSASQDGECTAINQDTVAPVITLTTPVTFDATDYLTPIKVTVTANDVLDGAVDVTLAEGSKNLRPGVHTLVWAATDAAGNRGTQSQTVNIRPLVNLGGSTVIGEGREVSVQVKLSGEGISYPVTASVSTSGDVSASDFMLNTTSVEIGESGETNLLVSVVSDGVIESDETLILTLEEVSSNAVLPASANYQILIVDRNVAPEAALSLTQNDQTVSTVYQDGGAVLVSLSVTDANMDATTSDWQTSTVNGTLSDDLSSFSFDPSGLEAGKSYQLSVDVSDGVAITRTFVAFSVAANQPVLDAANDSDGDGIDDVTEGLGDSDGDGVADYQDAVNDPTRLSAGNSAAETSNLMAVGTGLQMSLGSTALGQGQGGAFIGSDAVTDDDGNVIKDGDFNVIGGLYDFVVKGLSEAKRTAQVVIPLAQSVPADASYRKFSDGQWFEFIENGTDFIQSANKVDGVCPLPGSALYQTGLLRFADCLQLNISDGGPNDADGEVNGVIVDPSGVAEVSSASDSESVSAPTDQPSGSGSLGWWSFLVLLTLLVRKQFRFFLTLLLKRTA
ncbi:putative Ig domain-containing protein, partial [Litoribacillus peritrichatus]